MIPLQVLHNLGVTYGNQGRFDDSVKLLQRTTNAKMKTLGDVEHPDVLSSMRALGVAYQKCGQLPLAVSCDA